MSQFDKHVTIHHQPSYPSPGHPTVSKKSPFTTKLQSPHRFPTQQSPFTYHTLSNLFQSSQPLSKQLQHSPPTSFRSFPKPVKTVTTFTTTCQSHTSQFPNPCRKRVTVHTKPPVISSRSFTQAWITVTQPAKPVNLTHVIPQPCQNMSPMSNPPTILSSSPFPTCSNSHQSLERERHLSPVDFPTCPKRSPATTQPWSNLPSQSLPTKQSTFTPTLSILLHSHYPTVKTVTISPPSLSNLCEVTPNLQTTLTVQ
nr:mucin-2-like [Penaeus vannamei]